MDSLELKRFCAEALFAQGIRTRDVAIELRVPPSVVGAWRVNWWNRRSVECRMGRRENGGRVKFRDDDQNDRNSYCPSEDEIAAKCVEIRKTWFTSRLAAAESEPPVETREYSLAGITIPHMRF